MVLLITLDNKQDKYKRNLLTIKDSKGYHQGVAKLSSRLPVLGPVTKFSSIISLYSAQGRGETAYYKVANLINIVCMRKLCEKGPYSQLLRRLK